MLLLLAKGYRLRHRNWQGPAGELDLVVEGRGEVVFVEVKTRRGDLFGGAVEAVHDAKRRSLARTAAAYLGRYELWQRPCRFDVLTIERRSGFPFWRVRHITDAFRPDLGRLM
jgi:putative endonuclease